jgi:DNA polymerase-3 subunit beta
VLVATDEGRLRLSATNLELGITCWIGAKVEEEGETTVPARTFIDLVNTLSEEKIEMSLTVRTQTLNIRAGTSNTDIKCIDAQEFPQLPAMDMVEGVQISAADLKEVIRQVVFSASTDEARPILTGVKMEVDGSQITLAAADGFRLSVRSARLPSPDSQPVSAVIPARALHELARVIGDSDEVVGMVIPSGRGQVVFRTKDIELVSQLIEGVFPEYEQIIPKGYETRTVLTTSAFLKACRQAEIFAREGSNIARLEIKPSADMGLGNVQISAQSEQSGSNETFVDATIEGDPVLIAFNVRYLREVLDVITTPDVALETTAPASPGVIRPVGDDSFIHVIMPMHLGN